MSRNNTMKYEAAQFDEVDIIQLESLGFNDDIPEELQYQKQMYVQIMVNDDNVIAYVEERPEGHNDPDSPKVRRYHFKKFDDNFIDKKVHVVGYTIQTAWEHYLNSNKFRH